MDLIKTALSSLHDTHQKSEDDNSDIKPRRDNFVTETSDIEMKVQQLFSMVGTWFNFS